MNDEERAHIEAIKRGGSGLLIHADAAWLLDLVERQEARARTQFQRIEALELCLRESNCNCGHKLKIHDLHGCEACDCHALHAVSGDGVASS